MVDPRIYRGFLIVVAFAVIVFGFSLHGQPTALGTSIGPGQFFANAGSTARSLARSYPERAPGSAGDRALAAYVAGQIRADGGFGVATRTFAGETPAGTRQLQSVVATRPGLGSGTIVLVSQRDSIASPAAAAHATATAELSGTAVMLDLAKALSGETLARSVMLVSTSGQIGAAGATQLARSLAGQQLDGVIVLGDLASRGVRSPVVVPWSDTDLLTPPLLSRTLSAFVGSETGIAADTGGLAGQVARLALPFAITAQAPFAGHGIGAVLLSLSGDRLGYGTGTLAATGRTAGLGMAVLQTVNALDHGAAVGAPSAYLVISGQLVPQWAVRLLVLALILPVAAAA
ncbi:MAG: hypothetical protein KGL16_10215, partial [Acidobacteriota bacterium]|nr:hypothetical protein [Acidobacteriota bacterium]